MAEGLRERAGEQEGKEDKGGAQAQGTLGFRSAATATAVWAQVVRKALSCNPIFHLEAEGRVTRRPICPPRFLDERGRQPSERPRWPLQMAPGCPNDAQRSPL